MGRADLIEIIYQYQKREQELLKENENLRTQLESKEILIEESGSIAEAAMNLNEVFKTAQAAADQYVLNIKEKADKYLMELKERNE